MEHHSISYRPFPATLDIKESHIEVTNGKGVGCEGTTVMMYGISVRGRSVHIEVGAVNGSKWVSKKWKKLVVIEDV